MVRRGAIVLCGGQSLRMGQDKANLPFGPNETLLQRVVRLVSGAISGGPIVCVAAADQKLPRLPSAVQMVVDPVPHRGPLAGLATGLAAIQNAADAVYVSGCDVPLLQPAFVTHMFELIGDHQIAAPHDGQRWHPLAAVYRTDVLPQADALLATGERSVVALIESCRTRRVTTSELRDVDADLASLVGCNTEADYEFALHKAGF